MENSTAVKTFIGNILPAVSICLLLGACSSFHEVETGTIRTKGKTDFLCHYMSWFRFSESDGIINFDHWAWDGKNAKHNPNQPLFAGMRDIASVFYPSIGVYDSSDPETIDYHILSAKTAGIQGFVIDWYGKGGFVDESFEKLLVRSEKMDFKAAICYEEKTCFPSWNKISERDEAVKKAAADFKYMAEKFFSKKSYFRKNGKPCVFIFGGWGDWPGKGKLYFSSEEWDKIIEAAGGDIYIIRQNFNAEYKNIRSAFAWCGNDDYLKWFYRTGDKMLEDRLLDFYCGSACPGFDDRGVWGWGTAPRFEAPLGTENYSRYWREFEKSSADIIQLVTWNDFQEGTVIEPTVQNGNLYLEMTMAEIQKLGGNVYGNPADIEIPYMIFYLKGKLSGDSSADSILESAKLDILAGNPDKARAAIKSLADEKGIKIPKYIDITNEIKPASFASPENEKARKALERFSNTENIANLAKAEAISSEGEGRSADLVCDGKIETRWASAHEDNQRLQLSFDKAVKAGEAAILWEDAFAHDYTVSIVSEGKEVEVFATKSGAKGLQSFKMPEMPFTSFSVNCGKRATNWGFSIREIGIFSKELPLPEGFSAAWRGIPAPGKWRKDDAVEWREKGFGIAPSSERNYGCVEMTEKVPLNENASACFEIDKTANCKLTFQMQLFNDKGEYIGAVDLGKDIVAPAKEIYQVGKLKLDPSVKNVNFKIWIGSQGKGYAEFKNLSYFY